MEALEQRLSCHLLLDFFKKTEYDGDSNGDLSACEASALLPCHGLVPKSASAFPDKAFPNMLDQQDDRSVILFSSR